MTIFQSVHGSGKATAPTAGTDIATIPSASLPTGMYKVVVDAGLSAIGVAVISAGDVTNIQLAIGARPPIAIPAQGRTEMNFNLSGVEAITVEAVANGTANIIYTVGITATGIG